MGTLIAANAEQIALYRDDVGVQLFGWDGKLQAAFPEIPAAVRHLAVAGDRVVAVTELAVFVWRNGTLDAAWEVKDFGENGVRDAGGGLLLGFADDGASWLDLANGKTEDVPGLKGDRVYDLLPDGSRVLGRGLAAPGANPVLPEALRGHMETCHFLPDKRVACVRDGQREAWTLAGQRVGPLPALAEASVETTRGVATFTQGESRRTESGTILPSTTRLTLQAGSNHREILLSAEAAQAPVLKAPAILLVGKRVARLVTLEGKPLAATAARVERGPVLDTAVRDWLPEPIRVDGTDPWLEWSSRNGQLLDHGKPRPFALDEGWTPAVNVGDVVVLTDKAGHFRAVALQDHAERWTLDAGTLNAGCIRVDGTLQITIGEERRVVDWKTGKVLGTGARLDPVSPDGRIQVSGGRGTTPATLKFGGWEATVPARSQPLGAVGDIAVVHAIEPTSSWIAGWKDGKEYWRYPLYTQAGSSATARLVDGLVIGTGRGGTVAVDAKTGRVAWVDALVDDLVGVYRVE